MPQPGLCLLHSFLSPPLPFCLHSNAHREDFIVCTVSVKQHLPGSGDLLCQARKGEVEMVGLPIEGGATERPSHLWRNRLMFLKNALQGYLTPTPDYIYWGTVYRLVSIRTAKG